jgi:nucleoid-associated protein YgaU
MQFANNKFIATLVISNIVAFSVIFILIWMLWDNGDTINNPPLSTTNISQPEKSKPATQPKMIQKKTVTIVDEIAQEVKLANLAPDETANLDSSDTGKLSDKEYIRAFKKTENNQKAILSYTEKEVATIQASNKTASTKNSTDGKDKNNLNIVDVSQLRGDKKEHKTLAQRVSSLVSESRNNHTNSPNTNPRWQDYLKKLDLEGAKRKNEMRIIKVKRGETLWRISIRAYGTGFRYKDIFKANPHLTSPHSIVSGEILRVPL